MVRRTEKKAPKASNKKPAKGTTKPKKGETKKADAKPAKEVKITPVTRHLKIKLTNDEINDRGHLAAKYRRDIANQEAELKSFSGTVKARISTLEGQLDTALQEFDSGCTYRDVDCHEVWDYEERVVKIVRLDTREEVERRDMTRNELQLPLPSPQAPKADGTEKMPCHGKPSPEAVENLKQSAVERLNEEGDRTASELRARSRKQEALHEAIEEAEQTVTDDDEIIDDEADDLEDFEDDDDSDDEDEESDDGDAED